MCTIRLKEEIDLEEDDCKEKSNSYNTPPEDNTEEQTDKILADNEEDVDPINPNTAEVTDDKIENYSMFDNESDIEEMTHNQSIDTSIDLAKFLNYPDILDVKPRGSNSSSTDEEVPLSEIQKSYTKRSRSHSPSG